MAFRRHAIRNPAKLLAVCLSRDTQWRCVDDLSERWQRRDIGSGHREGKLDNRARGMRGLTARCLRCTGANPQKREANMGDHECEYTNESVAAFTATT